MALNAILNRAGRFITDNSPTILTTIAVTGTLTTAFLTGKASFKAAEIIAEKERVEGTAGDPVQRFKDRATVTWKLYVPAASSAAMTVVCIVAANRIGTRRTAALAAAYSVAERMRNEYEAKVVEAFGERKEQKVRDELAQDRVTANPVSNREVIITGRGEFLCFETYTARYFQSDMQTIRKAENDINQTIINTGYGSLTDFYHLIGLPPTSHSDEMGWNTDQLMDLQYSTTLSDDDRPCMVIDYRVAPIRGYSRIG